MTVNLNNIKKLNNHKKSIMRCQKVFYMNKAIIIKTKNQLRLTISNGRVKSLRCIVEICWGFPGGAVVESLPANAGDTGSSPGLGRSHMPWSNWAHGPQLLSLCVWNLCSATGEAAIVRGLCTATRESPCTETKTQHSQK